jgi:protein SCO1/2
LVISKYAGLTLALAVLGVGCAQPPPAKQYPLTGQVLAVNLAKQEITVKHDDIPGLMPAMTMTYAVSSPALLAGRAPGETVSATLEVRDALGRITAITHTGTAPLPANTNEAALAGGILDVGDVVDDVALVDQADRRRSLAEWKGTLSVVTFIYTRCPLPDFCPLMDQNFATLQRRVTQDPALRGRVRLISVTLDPEFDTPAVLAEHAARRHADPAIWTFLTGDRGTIERLAGHLGVGVIRDGSPMVTHNLRTAILDGDLRILKVYSGNEWTPGEVLKELAAVKK